MTVKSVSVDLLANDATVVQAGLRVDGTATFYADELNDTGAAQVTLPASVPGASSIDAGSLLRFKVDGTTDFTARVVPPIDRTVAAKNLADVQFVVHAKGWLDEWSDHLVQPPMGRSKLPTWDEVIYDWRHPIVPITGSAPTYLGSLFGGDVDPMGGPAVTPPTAKSGWPPRNWADTFTGWISGHAVDGSGSHATDAVCYATVDLPVSSGKLNGQFSADDVGELAIGGVVLSSCSNWTQAQDWGLDDVASGTLTLRVKVENAVVAGNPSNTNNPLAWAVTVWQATGSDPSKVFANVLARTGANTSGGAALTDGGKWTAMWSPGSPPGITVARAVRHQFELAQAAGGPLTSWTLDFSDSVDSNGSSWPVRDDITARTSDTLLVWLRLLCARGMCDIQADPTARKLRMFLPGHCGNFWTSPGSPPAWTGAHLSQVDVARRW